MGAKQETGHDAEVPAAAAQSPEKVGVVRFGGGDETAVGQNHVRLDQTVDREAVLAAEVAMTAAERETGDAGCRDDSERHGLAEGLVA